MHGADGPALTRRRDLAVGHAHVRVEVNVQRLLHLRFAGSLRRGGRRDLLRVGLVRRVVVHPIGVEGVRAVRNGRRTAVLTQPRGQRRVVAVTVRDQDRNDAFTLQRSDERGTVRIRQRAGVDDRDVTATDDVGAGAVVGELGRVLRNHPPDERRNFHGLAVVRIVEQDKGDAHGAMARTVPTW
mgnify:CR=1 FL=1